MNRIELELTDTELYHLRLALEARLIDLGRSGAQWANEEEESIQHIHWELANNPAYA